MIQVKIYAPVKEVRTPMDSIPVYQNGQIIDEATIGMVEGEIMAKTSLKMDFEYLWGNGDLRMEDGDIIDEILIRYLCVPQK